MKHFLLLCLFFVPYYLCAQTGDNSNVTAKTVEFNFILDTQDNLDNKITLSPGVITINFKSDAGVLGLVHDYVYSLSNPNNTDITVSPSDLKAIVAPPIYYYRYISPGILNAVIKDGKGNTAIINLNYKAVYTLELDYPKTHDITIHGQVHTITDSYTTGILTRDSVLNIGIKYGGYPTKNVKYKVQEHSDQLSNSIPLKDILGSDPNSNQSTRGLMQFFKTSDDNDPPVYFKLMKCQ